eukprot:CAMPEP_0168528474 /NCGR_PEP_ID=MMETSP0405-20121227/13278_1 /TAXON_ID=498012 /ORGANISM="Trichosphaerium sp, Strain Am-I-7 wt" /LENGTH=259 /DNA_ID=CAMNT_0008551901 /DNA_START=32 /DNA_END=808 /DNA_ORIENTATION=+
MASKLPESPKSVVQTQEVLLELPQTEISEKAKPQSTVSTEENNGEVQGPPKSPIQAIEVPSQQTPTPLPPGVASSVVVVHPSQTITPAVVYEPIVTHAPLTPPQSAVTHVMTPPRVAHEKQIVTRPIQQATVYTSPQVMAHQVRQQPTAPVVATVSGNVATSAIPVRASLPNPPGENYVDITTYLSLPQREAANRLGLPMSTLSKRWKDAVPNRKWPYRTISKLDKEIMVLLHNIPQNQPVPKDIEKTLTKLLKERDDL